VVVSIHTGLFSRTGESRTVRALVRLAPFNLVSALLVLAAVLVEGVAAYLIWTAAFALEWFTPRLASTGGFRIAPAHFVERHGLVVIVALGESIVAIGVGAGAGVDGGVIAAAVIGVAVACALWWAYFDGSAPAATGRLAGIEPVPVRNRLARDGYSYLHLPMVAAIVLVALGMKATLAHVGDPLGWETATALVGGVALYLLAHVAFKLRVLRVLSVHRLVAALALVAFVPVAHRLEPLVTVGVVATLLWLTFALEAIHHGEARRAIRHAEHIRHSGD
jgi:low temperature requirement protein LtrA